MRWWALSASLALPIPTAAFEPVPPAEFALQPIMAVNGKDIEGIALSFAFLGEEDGTTEVKLPDRWASEKGLFWFLSNFRVENGSLQAGADRAKLIIRHKPSARLTLRYQLNRVENTEKGTNDYRPLVTPDFFHIIGYTYVVSPSSVGDQTPIEFRKGSFPTDLSFASDLEHQPTGLLRIEDLRQSVAVGGDYRILDAGGGARLAIRGKADKRDDAQWIASFRRIAEAQRAYWRAESGPYLATVSLIPSADPQSQASGGTGLGDAFSFVATQNIDPRAADYVLAHEYMHSWVPMRIGDLPSRDGPEEATYYWLSEGFTDFATYRVLVRAGIWTPEEFAAEFNRSLSAYDRSAFREKPNAETARLFWTDPDAGKIPYYRGMMFASWLDREVSRKSKGRLDIDNILLEMQRQAAANREKKAPDLLKKILKKSGVSAETAIRDFIETGKAAPLDPQHFGACGSVISKEEAIFELGFDKSLLTGSGSRASGVIEGSAAWKAGLRNGMKVLGWSNWNGDTSKEAMVQIEQGGEVKELKWMPLSAQGRLVRRFEISKGMSAAQRQVCIARLAGLDGNES